MNLVERGPIAVFLCDVTGIMAEPWAEAGIECFCVDIQHSIRRDRKVGNINFIWGDVRNWAPPPGRRIVFGAAFTPCTHQSDSGARDFAKKGGYMLRDGLEMFEAGRQVLRWSGAPYCCENPVGVLSSIPHIGKPDYYFHPHQYTGWCPDDNYTKLTCLWTGNGFVMPPEFKDHNLGPPDDRINKAPPTDDRADIRSATPRGFARATFHANAPAEYLRTAA
jgi:hypothetical protein